MSSGKRQFKLCLSGSDDIQFQILCRAAVFLLVPVTPLPKVENIAPSITSSVHSDHSPGEQNGFTMSSSSHDAASPPPESNGTAVPNIDKKNKKKLSIGGSFTKFWKSNKKVKDNGMELNIRAF